MPNRNLTDCISLHLKKQMYRNRTPDRNKNRKKKGSGESIKSFIWAAVFSGIGFWPPSGLKNRTPKTAPKNCTGKNAP